jgi:N-acetylglutamate synthase-like GNAT family acetyltransferase
LLRGLPGRHININAADPFVSPRAPADGFWRRPVVGVRIEPATAADGPAISRLLVASGLPVDGLLDHLATALVARLEGRIVGCAALEVYPDGALLRSVAVEAVARSLGIGRQLTQAALDMAHRLGVPAIFLLTTTAEHFFPRFGFSKIERDDVPAGVRTSVEFRSACPASAIVMHRRVMQPDLS